MEVIIAIIGHPERAEEAGRKMAFGGIVINIFVAAILYCFASGIANVMSTDAAVASTAAEYLRIIA